MDNLWFRVLSLRQKLNTTYLNGLRHLNEEKDEDQNNWMKK
jgi:hypothetical protein